MAAVLCALVLISQEPSQGPTVELPPVAEGGAPEGKTELRITAPEKPSLPLAGSSRKLESRRDTELPGAGNFVLGMVLVFALLALMFFLLRRWMGKSKYLGAGVIRILARKPLAQKQLVYLLEVGPKIFLVGATKDQLSALGEFSTPEDISVLREQSPVHQEDSVEGTFRATLREGLRDEETPPPADETAGNVYEELKNIRQTVMGWKA